jgi:hypothetical protein
MEKLITTKYSINEEHALKHFTECTNQPTAVFNIISPESNNRQTLFANLT